MYFFPFLPPRAPKTKLADFCRSLATQLRAGIDIRTALTRQAEAARPEAFRERIQLIALVVNEGGTVSEGLAEGGDYFPSLVSELMNVGEQSGHAAEVLEQLAGHYERQIQLRRTFLAQMTWPMAELILSVFVVGAFIWFLGFVGKDNPMDGVFFGLKGTPGLLIYIGILLTIGVGIYLVMRAIRWGLFWTWPIQHAVLEVPILGMNLQTLCLARMAWVMHLTTGSGMPLRKAMRLSLDSTRNARYTDQIGVVDSTLAAGNPVHEALDISGVFGPDFVDAVRIGEESGRLPESMETLSNLYRERAAAALSTLATLAGFAAMGMVGCVIIFTIFRIATSIFGLYESAGAI